MTNYNLDESTVLSLIENNPKLFENLEPKSHAMIIKMIEHHPQILLEWFRKTCERCDCRAEHIDNSTSAALYKAIAKNPYNIDLLNYLDFSQTKENMSFIKNLTLTALNKNGLAIKFLKTPYELYQEAAVKNNPEALLSLDTPSLNVVKLALEKRPDLFNKVDNIKKIINKQAEEDLILIKFLTIQSDEFTNWMRLTCERLIFIDSKNGNHEYFIEKKNCEKLIKILEEFINSKQSYGSGLADMYVNVTFKPTLKNLIIPNLIAINEGSEFFFKKNLEADDLNYLIDMLEQENQALTTSKKWHQLKLLLNKQIYKNNS